jgi:hypothetical protein
LQGFLRREAILWCRLFYLIGRKTISLLFLANGSRVTRWVCEKVTPKCSPTHFLSKQIHNFYFVIMWKILLLFIWIGSDPSFFLPISHCLILTANLLTLPIYFCRSVSITILPIYTTVPPTIEQDCFGLKTVWIK